MDFEYSADEISEKTRPDSLNGPFSYFGSKNRISDQLISLFPPHYAWVEAFCGSASITFAKQQVPIEIINDIDDQIVNFFKQLRDNKDALLDLITLTPYALSEFYLSQIADPEISFLEKARRFAVRAMMTVNGAYGESSAGFSFSQSYSRNNVEARVNRWNNLPDRLIPIAERLKSVRIEKRDAIELVKMFINRPATLIYLDPPYLMSRSHKYKHDVNNEVYHKELLQICNMAKCMIVISGYQSELYDKLLTEKRGWAMTKLQTKTRSTSGEDSLREELVWQNKHAIKAIKKNKVPIRLSSKEIKNRKYNPER